MKISFVIGSLNYSGAEKVLSELIKKLALKKNEISLLLLDDKENYYEIENNIKVYGCFVEGSKLSRIIKRREKIKTTLKLINPDLVVSFGHVCNINTISSLIGNRNYPLIVCERNDPFYDPRSFSQKVIRNFLYRFSNGYVFQTKEIQSYFSKSIQFKSAVISNPVIDLNIKQKEYTNFNFNLVTVGRLDRYQKNQMLLIRAFENILQYHPEAKLNIYGEGPSRNEYQKYINSKELEESIFLRGKVEDLNEKILENDIFILCSRFEGMPNALIEAMSFGMPCISTDCGGGGAKALINNNKNGLVVPNFNIKELELAIQKMISNKEFRIECGMEARKITEKLEINQIVDEWIYFFKKVVKKEIKK